MPDWLLHDLYEDFPMHHAEPLHSNQYELLTSSQEHSYDEQKPLHSSHISNAETVLYNSGTTARRCSSSDCRNKTSHDKNNSENITDHIDTNSASYYSNDNKNTNLNKILSIESNSSGHSSSNRNLQKKKLSKGPKKKKMEDSKTALNAKQNSAASSYVKNKAKIKHSKNKEVSRVNNELVFSIKNNSNINEKTVTSDGTTSNSLLKNKQPSNTRKLRNSTRSQMNYFTAKTSLLLHKINKQVNRNRQLANFVGTEQKMLPEKGTVRCSSKNCSNDENIMRNKSIFSENEILPKFFERRKALDTNKRAGKITSIDFIELSKYS